MVPQKQAEAAIDTKQDDDQREEERVDESLCSFKSLVWHGGSIYDAWFNYASNQHRFEFSGFEFLVVGGAGSSNRGPEAAVGSCGGVDLVGVDVGVEALEEENGDLEEGERESEKGDLACRVLKEKKTRGKEKR
ncbi:Auxin transporter-like protein 4 [Camellia lanceoleosa]|uniref:Auxin transporter-like protein 4 n=1 Tax=Camellia lanceoleosa TaxID=1840588 RepID=A0ACC0GE39_9ERIC|nr:Auxin transporter-like protein 4 [Camellia lanceoleosa]